MQRHRNHEQFLWRLARKLRNGLCEQLAEPMSSRVQSVIFKSVHRIFQPAVVCAIGHGAYKRRRRKPARAAEIGGVIRADGVEGIAAARARGFTGRRNLGPAGSTNWHGGKLRQERAAKRAGGGKKGAG